MLSVKDHMTLALEAQRFRYPGAKETAIRATFSEPPAQFYARVLRLLDEPEAMRAHPQLVSRLRRLREQRRAVRGAA